MKKLEQKENLWVDQLYPEGSFLELCNKDPAGTSLYKFGERIDEKFLEACEKDKFILPLHTETVIGKDEAGKEVEKQIKYYSPFQIFFVTALSKNSIDEDGHLRDLGTMDLEYQTTHKTRYINWGGGSSFNISANDMREMGHPNMYNHFTLAKDFHNFLNVLHSCKVYDETSERDYLLMRHGYNLPKLQYKFEREKDLKQNLEKHNLDIPKLEKMLKNIGHLALNIDPNKDWYTYIQKHPQRKRDEFRGMAFVAQELYNLCNIFIKIIELIDKRKLPPFIQYVYSGFSFIQDKQINIFAEGSDILVVQKAAQDLILWLKNNKEYLDEFYANNPEVKVLPFLENAVLLEKQILSFCKKYGDVRHVGNIRKVIPSKFKYADLEPLVRRNIDMIFISEGNNKARRLTPEEKEEHVDDAIMSTVGDFRRFVIDYCAKIRDMLYKEKYRQEGLKRTSITNISKEYFLQDRNGMEEGLYTNNFYSEYLLSKQKVSDDAMKEVENMQGELGGIISKTSLVFCAKCRKNYVVMHEEHNNYRAPDEAICDSCIESGALKKIESGEWRCVHMIKGKECNEVLFKFAHNNILSTALMKFSNAEIRLNYGQMNIEVKCHTCGNLSTKQVDWGWLP